MVGAIKAIPAISWGCSYLAAGSDTDTAESEQEGSDDKKLLGRIKQKMHPGARFVEVAKRTIVGTLNDGTIHAGNLAYMTMLSIFPFFILGAAVFSIIGEEGDRSATINAVLIALPPVVRDVIGPVARDVITSRSGWLLWAGGAVGLWTVSGLVETLRDILRRAYGTSAKLAFWRYRILSFGIIMAAMSLLIVSLIAQVLIGTAQQIISAFFPLLNDILAELSFSRIIPGVGLYLSIYLLFFTLTPAAYRNKKFPKWPGALLVTGWWVSVTIALPPVLGAFFSYNMTYGSLAGIMIALFFFWLIGLGMVLGAELNAALADTPDERDRVGKADDRRRKRAAMEDILE
jgi:membrane protein